jgi:hypothetical protein
MKQEKRKLFLFVIFILLLPIVFIYYNWVRSTDNDDRIYQNDNNINQIVNNESIQVNSKRINVVLGMAKGLNTADLSIFVNSWRTYSPETRIVLWIDAARDHSIKRDICEKYNCECIDWKNSKYGHMLPNDVYEITNARNYLNLFYLEDHPEIEFVVASDTRDVFIQADPFKYVDLKKTGFIFSMEGKSELGIRMADEKYNIKWARECFGDREEIFKVVAAHPVICCGVHIATREQMILFYRLAAILQEPGMFMHKCRKLFGTDTTLQHGILYLMRNRDIETNPKVLEIIKNFRYTVMHNFESPIYTVGYAGHTGKYDQGYKMVRVSKEFDGEIPPIVHQYDRFKSIIPKLRAHYRN